MNRTGKNAGRWFRRMKGASLEGSFTVETTLLMMIILPVMIGLIIAGMFVHDRAKLQGYACELAARGSCLTVHTDRNAVLQRTASVLENKGTMWTRNVGISASANEEHASAGAAGSFSFPGFTGDFLESMVSSCSGEWERQIYHPAGLIRKVRGLHALHEKITSAGNGE